MRTYGSAWSSDVDRLVILRGRRLFSHGGLLMQSPLQPLPRAMLHTSHFVIHSEFDHILSLTIQLQRCHGSPYAWEPHLDQSIGTLAFPYPRQRQARSGG